MSGEPVTKAVVVASANANPHQTVMRIALTHPDGTGDVSLLKKQAAQADTTAADLAALKVDFNALLAKLRLAGVISS